MPEALQRHKRSTAVPGESLGAHDGRRSFAAEVQDLLQPDLEFTRSHVACEGSKAAVSPPRILPTDLAALPASSELRLMLIARCRGGTFNHEGLRVEPRVMGRPLEAADVDERPDGPATQDLN